jgi:two-component system, cell cycle sensor histidine kinase and response regulator CckA
MSGETVLIVDDEPGVLEFVATVLRKGGYVVIKAADGLAALELAALHPGQIDLLLTDVRMPGLLGPELCERLRGRRHETRYLLMSGQTDGIGNSGLAFLPKPFRIADLLRSVRQALDTTAGQPAEPLRSARAASPSSSSR